MCNANGANLISHEPRVAKRIPHPRDPFRRRHDRHGLATGARGRCRRASAAPRCAAGRQLQSDFSADLGAANWMLYDPVLCCVARNRAVEKMRGQREKVRMVCATPKAPINFAQTPKAPSAFHTPAAPSADGAAARSSPRASAGAAAALAPPQKFIKMRKADKPKPLSRVSLKERALRDMADTKLSY